MRWLAHIGAGALLALGLVATAFAAPPAGTTAASAIPLATSATKSGTLTGSAAGAFAYYTFAYPGDGSLGTLTLNVHPSDPATESGVGLNVYQGAVRLTGATAVSGTPGTNAVTFSSSVQGPVLAQVYNYNPGEAVSYQLTLSGVNQSAPATQATPTATPTPPPAPAGTTAAQPARLMTSASGTLAGNPAGSFAYYTADYPTAGVAKAVTFTFSPPGGNVSSALVVNVFQNGTLLASEPGTWAQSPGKLTVDYSSPTAGPVLIQIGNYTTNPETTISYTLSQ